MDKFFVSTNDQKDGKLLLFGLDKQLEKSNLAKSLTYYWQDSKGFPQSVKKVFEDSGIYLFQDIEMLIAFPGWKVQLPDGKRASRNDIFVLARGSNQLVAIMVEGRACESFGKVISEWKTNRSKVKQKRLEYLCDLLCLNKYQVDHIHYQLLFRTACVIKEAKRFNSENALMLIHSLRNESEKATSGFQAYCQFLSLFGLKGRMDSLTRPVDMSGIRLYFGWVNE